MKTRRRILIVNCEDISRVQQRHGAETPCNKWGVVHIELLPSAEHQAKGFAIGDYLVFGLTEADCKRVKAARLKIIFERELG